MPNEFVIRNGAQVSSSLAVTGSTTITGSSDVLNAQAGAGGSAPVFNVFGTAGQLFTVTDGLEGSLFSVNTISGLPIMEAFSTGRINLGAYSSPALTITGSNVNGLNFSGSLRLTGSILGTNTSYISIGTTSSVARINAYGTTNVVSIYGSTSEGVMFDVNGPSGQLFSVVDGLSGSLFSVNTISGLPIMEAFSNATIRMGNYGAPGLIVTGSSVIATGSFSGSFSGSFTGTSTTASFAATASFVNPLTQSVLIRGTGTTSATTAFLVQNASGNPSLTVLDNNNIVAASNIGATGSLTLFDPDITNPKSLFFVSNYLGTSYTSSIRFDFEGSFGGHGLVYRSGRPGFENHRFQGSSGQTFLLVNPSGITTTGSINVSGYANSSMLQVTLHNNQVGGRYSNEGNMVFFNLSSSQYIAHNGETSVKEINAFKINAPYEYISTNTKTNDFFNTVLINGTSRAGTFVTNTNSAALKISGSTLTTAVTNSYGLYVQSSVGATNNYAATFLGGNVGIGTSNPNYVLDVSGSSEFIGNVLITGSLTVTGSTNITSLTSSNAIVTGNVTVLGTASINTLVVNQTQLSTGSNQLGDAANDTQTLFGTVRIPTGSLTVTGSITSSQDIQINSATFGIGSNVPTSQSLNIGWNNLTASAQEYYYGNIAVGVNNLQATNWGNYNVAIGVSSLSSNTSGSRNIAIGSGPLNLNTIGDYNIGIGSAAMSQNKSGSHNIAMGFQSLLQMGIGSTLDSNYNVALGLASGVNFQTGSYNIFLGTQNNYILSGSNNTFIGSRLNSATFGAPTIGLNNTVIIADGTGSIRFYSPSSSNVIIGGTTDLGYKLQVSGSGNFNNDLTTSGSFTAGVSSIGRYWSPTTIFDTGSANNGLTVRGDLVVAHTNNLSQLVFGYTNSTKYLFVGTDGIGPYFKGTTVLDIRVVNGSDVGLYVRSDNTAFFNSSNVSINGTTGLGEKTLQVNGSGRFTNTLSVTGSTDIRGAGSTSSTYGLSVVNASGTSSLYVSDNGNVGIGNTSPNYKLDVSGSSEFVGNMLVTGSITASADSYFNTIRVGLGANNVFRNTAIGAETGQFITSGDENTVVGYRAGQFLSTGIRNIVIGTNSGNNLQSGNDNVILAINGASFIGAGSRNIILGTGANFNPSGNNNIVIGYQALSIGAGGHSNSVAVGYRALYATSAGNNVAVGYEAGTSNGGSSNMAALGYQALSGSTGANNTALGSLAGFNNTSGANNIFIGYLSTGSSVTESNRTWIGNSSTTSTWLAGKVLIGTRNTSSAILDIYKSGSTVVDIQGSQGQLFSVIDSLTGSLMSVNDVSGLPILEVFSSDTVVMGTYAAAGLVVTGSRVGVYTTTPSASLHVSGAFLGYPVTVPTASGTASLDCSRGNFFNLTLSSSYTLFLSASNVQPGQTINLRVTQPATSGSLNYGSQFKFAGGIPYTASSTGSAVDIISFITFDTTNLYGSAIKNLS